MRTTNTLTLGGGQAGLAISSWLTELGRDHLVVERGRIAERWHSERWNALRSLTNWMTRLPGWTYDAHYIAQHICRTRRQLTAVATGPVPKQK